MVQFDRFKAAILPISRQYVFYSMIVSGLLTSGLLFQKTYERDVEAAALAFEQVVIDAQGPNNLWLKSVGDLNGDGWVDLVAGGNSSGGLVWYQNPSWSKHTIAPGGGFSTDGEVVDVDGDGDNDVVVVTENDLRWYENPAWQVHVVGNQVLHDVEASDFDNDGDVDLVARNQGNFGEQGNELHFYRQNSPTSWTHGSLPCANGEGLEIADLDGDGDLDVIINGRWFKNTNNIISGPWPEYPYTSSWTHPATYVAVGDVNGDGRLDILLAPAELAGESYRLSWFEAPANPQLPNWPERVVANNIEAVHHFVGAADFDQDGDLDIAAAEMVQGNNPDEIKVYMNNNGAGTIWSKQVLATTGSHSMRLLDVDQDGDVDLYGGNWQDNQVEVYKNLTCMPGLSSWNRQVLVLDANRLTSPKVSAVCGTLTPTPFLSPTPVASPTMTSSPISTSTARVTPSLTPTPLPPTPTPLPPTPTPTDFATPRVVTPTPTPR